MAERQVPVEVRNCQWTPHGEDRECLLMDGNVNSDFWMCRSCVDANPQKKLVIERRSGDRRKG